jgi:aspartyl aminopeptidase
MIDLIDSPVLRVKPVSKRVDEGYLSVGVETYGGGIWHTWFDRYGLDYGWLVNVRDLSLAGRILLSSSSSKQVTHRLIRLDKPLLRIPTIAIHLDRTQNDAFKFNRETEFRPITGLVEDTLNTPASTPSSSSGESAPIESRHHSELLSLLSTSISEPVEQIKDFELVLYDTQPPCLGGINDEFIFAPRLDNLCMSFCAVKAIEEASGLENDDTVRLISLFDHEVRCRPFLP